MDDGQVEELASLRAEVARLRARVEAPKQGMSRRHLLRAAPAVALGGALAAVAGASPASAADGDPVLQGEDNHYGTSTTALFGGDPSSNRAALDVTGGSRADVAALGAAALPTGDAVLSVTPEPMTSSDPGPGHPAVTIFGGEVVGPFHNTGKPGLRVETEGPAAALEVNISDGFVSPGGPSGPAVNVPGTGIQVTSQSSTAVDVSVSESTTSHDAVTITYAGTSRAFYAISSSATNINGTVTGVNRGHGIGVWGEQQNNTVSGIGVVGLAGSLGRGGQFQGGAAALRLVPATASTHPTTGKVGDVFVDSGARIWFCTHASSGSTAATWRQLAFV
jgi:hypothetical protein